MLSLQKLIGLRVWVTDTSEALDTATSGAVVDMRWAGRVSGGLQGGVGAGKSLSVRMFPLRVCSPDER
jgi:chorismate synthase